jgi:hypothetical protein
VYHRCINARSTRLHVRLACEFWVFNLLLLLQLNSEWSYCIESTTAWVQYNVYTTCEHPCTCVSSMRQCTKHKTAREASLWVLSFQFASPFAWIPNDHTASSQQQHECNTTYTQHVSIHVHVYYQCVKTWSTRLHVRLACEFWVFNLLLLLQLNSEWSYCIESTTAWVQHNIYTTCEHPCTCVLSMRQTMKHKTAREASLWVLSFQFASPFAAEFRMIILHRVKNSMSATQRIHNMWASMYMCIINASKHEAQDCTWG